MHTFPPSRSAVVSRRGVRAGVGVVVALVLAVSQGVEHGHSSPVEAAHCTVCHWGETRPAAQLALPILALPTIPVSDFGPAEPLRPSFEPSRSTPARAPPTPS